MKKIFRKLDSTGDTVLEFDPEVKSQADATAEAKALFERIKKAGGQAFDISKGPNEPAAPVKSFDEAGAETVLVPNIVGG